MVTVIARSTVSGKIEQKTFETIPETNWTILLLNGKVVRYSDGKVEELKEESHSSWVKFFENGDAFFDGIRAMDILTERADNDRIH
jgi:hypothetical protein